MIKLDKEKLIKTFELFIVSSQSSIKTLEDDLISEKAQLEVISDYLKIIKDGSYDAKD